MPIYTYECTKGHQIEVWQSISARPHERITHSFITPFTINGGGEIKSCRARLRRIIVATSGHIVEPNAMYEPAPGKDKNGRQSEVKITRREYERKDRKLRDELLALSKRGPRLDSEPKKQQTWI